MRRAGRKQKAIVAGLPPGEAAALLETLSPGTGRPGRRHSAPTRQGNGKPGRS